MGINRRDLLAELQMSGIPASALQMPGTSISTPQYPPQQQAQSIGYQQSFQQPMLPPVGPPPVPPSAAPQTDLLSAIGSQYINNKQDQSQRGGFVQDILSKRFEPTTQDSSDALYQNVQSVLRPNSFKSTTPSAVATDRLNLELAPYTTMAKLKELNQPYSEAGKLMYDVQEGLISPEVAQAQIGKGAVDVRLKEAQIRATEALANQRSSGGGGGKAPTGYRYSSDGTSLEAIPGGPATKLTPEAAAKTGAVEAALGNMNNIRKVMGSINAGSTIDWSMDRGDIGQAKRQITAGIEAALRAMSGAAVPPEEVIRYSNLYMPRLDDSSTTKQRKLDELQNFLSSASTGMKQGRTPGDNAALQEQQQPDYSGMTDEDIMGALSQ